MLVACRISQVLLQVLKLCKIEHEMYRIILVHLISIKNKTTFAFFLFVCKYAHHLIS